MITYCNKISVEDYNELRQSVEWPPIKPSKAQRGIDNTTCIIAMDEDKPVGMARILSDGGYVSYICDVIVRPEYQKLGIGKAVMNLVMEHIMGDLKEDETQMIILVAVKEKENFYTKFGFEVRPNENAGAGMTQWVKKVSKEE